MARKSTRPKLHVEGRNDLYALANLLVRHGIDYDQDEDVWPPEFPKFYAAVSDSIDPTRESAGLDAVLTAVTEEVRNQAGRTVGFVVDADVDPVNRWMELRDRLAGSRVVTLDPAPIPVQQLSVIPESGFVGVSEEYRTRVGIWMMPDNKSAGALERFLASLVPKDSSGTLPSLYVFAEQQTMSAPSNGAQFREVDLLKATLACWLAWQRSPGRPYGTAIRAGYFDKDSPEANLFVTWFKTLFQVTT